MAIAPSESDPDPLIEALLCLAVELEGEADPVAEPDTPAPVPEEGLVTEGERVLEGELVPEAALLVEG